MRAVARTLALSLLASAGCAFDPTGLEERTPCTTTADCAVGVCVQGRCFAGTLPDDVAFPDGAGVPDTGAQVDAPEDAPDDGTDGRPDGSPDTAVADDAGGDADPACEPGRLRCDGDRVLRCNVSGTGELITVVCEAPEHCVEGACQVTECPPGEIRCDGDRVSICGLTGLREDGPDCAALGVACVETADGPRCLGSLCEPGATRCTEAGRPERCDALGAAFVPQPDCLAGTRCVDGACLASECEPGTTRCADPLTLARCDERGAESAEPCGGGNRCVAADSGASCQPQLCRPGAAQCDDADAVLACNDAGDAFLPPAPCPPETFCEGGACVPDRCTPERTSCASATELLRCSARGDANDRVACPTGEFCDESETGAACGPRLCAPGELRCRDAATPERCAADGLSFEPLGNCEAGAVCVTGRCDAPTCGDRITSPGAGESCDDGNADACDGCDACARQGTLALTGASTTSRANVAVGEADVAIELWARVEGDGLLAGLGALTDSDHVVLSIDSGAPVFAYTLGSGRAVRVQGTPLTPGWHHLAAERFGLTHALLYVDGVAVAGSFADLDRTGIDGNPWLWIGSEGTAAAATAEIDEVRFSSQLRYGAAFVPPRRLAPDAGTWGLYHLDEAAGDLLDAGPAGRHLTTGGVRRLDDCRGGARCGDGVLEAGERCDDGNLTPGDGCGPTCTAESVCDGVPGLRGECYRLTGDDDWAGAEAQCVAWGGHLVTIGDEAENFWLWNVVATESNDYWIGLNDRTTEDAFGWISGAPVGYTRWNSGEPNDQFGEDCGAIISGDGGVWNDADCGDSLPAICEK